MSYIGASPDGKGSAERFLFTATGSTTDTVSHADSGLAISYEVNHVSVYLNGVKQVIGTGKDVVASNGSTLVFASNLAEHDVQEYARNRQAEYPDWGSQLNKIYDDGLTKWKSEMVDPIKAKYPKPE